MSANAIFARLEELVPDSPPWQDVASTTDIDAVAETVAGSFRKLLLLIDPIDSAAAMLKKKWLRIGAELELRARLLYVLGRYEEAMIDIRRVSEYFAVRQGMSVASLIKRHGLEKLKPLA